MAWEVPFKNHETNPPLRPSSPKGTFPFLLSLFAISDDTAFLLSGLNYTVAMVTRPLIISLPGCILTERDNVWSLAMEEPLQVTVSQTVIKRIPPLVLLTAPCVTMKVLGQCIQLLVEVILVP